MPHICCHWCCLQGEWLQHTCRQTENDAVSLLLLTAQLQMHKRTTRGQEVSSLKLALSY